MEITDFNEICNNDNEEVEYSRILVNVEAGQIENETSDILIFENDNTEKMQMMTRLCRGMKLMIIDWPLANLI